MDTYDAEFRAKFDSLWVPEPNSGCWLWLGFTKGQGGYAGINYNKRVLGAHRVSWELHNGSIPTGMFVCHKCDTPTCINPDHLFLGTPRENTADKLRKGRQGRGYRGHCGERNNKAKLTEDDVRAIRSLRASGVSAADLSLRFGVNKPSIHKVINRQSWAHIE